MKRCFALLIVSLCGLWFPARVWGIARNAGHVFEEDTLQSGDDWVVQGSCTLYRPDIPEIPAEAVLDEIFLMISYTNAPTVDSIGEIRLNGQLVCSPSRQGTVVTQTNACAAHGTNVVIRMVDPEDRRTLLVWYGFQDRDGEFECPAGTGGLEFVVPGNKPVTRVWVFISYHFKGHARMPDLYDESDQFPSVTGLLRMPDAAGIGSETSGSAMIGDPVTPTNSGAYVVFIHGWNGDSRLTENPAEVEVRNQYARTQSADGWFNLCLEMPRNALIQSQQWIVARYDWHLDAATGSKGLLPTTAMLSANAARNAASAHGLKLGMLLRSLNATQVQFYAHSAGNWVAKRAGAYLKAHNPNVQVQLSALDAFVNDDDNEFPAVDDLDLTENFMLTCRIFDYCENYYTVDDITSPTKSDVVGWTSGDYTGWNVNRAIETLGAEGLYDTSLRYHQGPVAWYARTVVATNLSNSRLRELREGFVNSLPIRGWPLMDKDDFPGFVFTRQQEVFTWYNYRATREVLSGADYLRIEPEHAGHAGGASLWMSWIAPRSGYAKISTHGSNFDTLLAAYNGEHVFALSPIAASDDVGEKRTGEIEINVASGACYRIAVDGKDGQVGQVRLALQLLAVEDVGVYRADTGERVSASSNRAKKSRVGRLPSPPPPAMVVPYGVGLYFEADVEDSEARPVKLEIEFVRVPDGFEGPLQYSSDFVESGSRARTEPVQTLALGTYEWRYRVVTDSGMCSDWMGADENTPLRFTVAPTRVVSWENYLETVNVGACQVPDGLWNVVAVAAGGGSHKLALLSDGTVQEWYDCYDNRVMSVPPKVMNVVKIAVASDFALALRADGTVVGWGDNFWHQLNVPPDLSNVVDIACAYGYGVAVRADGTVTAWGRWYEPWGDVYDPHGVLNVPASLSNVVSVSADNRYVMALRSDGSIVVWGDELEIVDAKAIPPLPRSVAIAAGGDCCYALLENGTVIGWPDLVNDEAYGDWAFECPYTGVVAISEGGLALLSDGTVRLLSPFAFDEEMPPGLTNVIAVASKEDMYLALQIAPTDELDLLQDTTPPVIYGCQDQRIDAGEPIHFMVRVMDDTDPNPVVVYDPPLGFVPEPGRDVGVTVTAWDAWGNTSTCHYTVSVLEDVQPPVISGCEDRVLIGWNMWGASVQNWVSVRDNADPAPTVVYDPPLGSFLPVGTNMITVTAWDAAGNTSVCAFAVTVLVDTTPSVIMGCESRVVTARSAAGAPVEPWVSVEDDAPMPPVVTYDPPLGTVLPIGDHTITVTARDGMGNSSVCEFPVRVEGDFTAPNISGCEDREVYTYDASGTAVTNWVVVNDDADPHPTVLYDPPLGTTIPVGQTVVNVMAFDASGNTNVCQFNVTVTKLPKPAVIAWGANWSGECNVPPTLSNVVGIAAGEEHTLALDGSGRVHAWGNNSYGQLDLPDGITNVIRIAAGAYHSLALQSDGTVAAWGADWAGQADVPGGLSNVVDIAAGVSHSLALCEDGRVVAWGANERGQCDVPASLRQAVKVAAGNDFSLALLPNGTVAMWGARTDVPPGLTQVVAIAAGDSHCVALTADGRVAVWGNNAFGKCYVPRGVSNAVAIAAGRNHTLALLDNGEVLAWGDNWDKQCNVPASISHVLAVAAGGNHSVALLKTYSDNDDQSAPAIYGCGERYVTARTSNGASVLQMVRVADDWDPKPTVFYDPPLASWISGTQVIIAVTAWDVSGNTNTCQIPVVIVADDAPPVIEDCAERTVLTWNPAGSPVQAWIRATDAEDPFPKVVYDPPLGTMLPLGESLVGVKASDSYGNTSECAFVVHVGLAPTFPLAIWGIGEVPTGDLSNIISVAAGAYHGLLLRSDGTVTAWGANWSGQATVPDDLSNVVAVAAGEAHSLALLENGTVRAWGDNRWGQCNVPDGLTGVVAIVAGRSHSLALTSDGRVVAWGDNTRGQCNVPKDLAGVVAIAAGWAHSLALLWDGRVVVWGDNSSGQCNVPRLRGKVIAIAAGGQHSLGLYSDGTVVAWGANEDLQCLIPVGLANVKAIAAGDLHSLAVRADGTVVAWGAGWAGQCNVPTGLNNVISVSAGAYYSLALAASDRFRQDSTPPRLYGCEDRTLVAPSPQGARAFCLVCAVDDADPNPRITYNPPLGTLLPPGQTSIVVRVVDAAGNSNECQFVVRVEPDTEAPVLVGCSNMVVPTWSQFETPVTFDIRAEDNACSNVVISVTPPSGSRFAIGDTPVHAVAWDAWGNTGECEFTVTVVPQTAWAWGDDQYGQVSIPLGLTGAVSAAAGENHTLVLLGNGQVLAFGNNDDGQCDVPTDLISAVAVAAGPGFSVALLSDGTVRAWGRNWDGQCNVPEGLSNVAAVAAGEAHVLALKADGTMVAWGRNWDGQCDVPGGLENVVGMAAGAGHSLALLANGSVVAWGRPWEGQCDVPQTITNAVAVAAGPYYSVALLSGGTVRVWGQYASGWLRPPNGLSNVTAIAAGYVHALALQADGTVVAWGRTNAGVCNVPTGLSGVTSVAAGGNHSVAVVAVLKADVTPPTFLNCTDIAVVSPRGLAVPVEYAVTARDDVTAHPVVLCEPPSGSWFPLGTSLVTVTAWDSSGNSNICQFEVRVGYPQLVAWGCNDSGQCDVPYERLGHVIGVAAGEEHSAALRSDGTVLAWGGNRRSQCNVPPKLTDVVMVAAGAYHTVALKTDGTVAAWGDNEFGQVNVPGDATSIVAVAAGAFHSLALRSDGRIIGWGDNREGQCNAPVGLHGVIAIAAGGYHSLALLADGTVTAWGNNEYGQCDTQGLPELSNVVAIAAGENHSLALRADGTVLAWGDNSLGQCDVPADVGEVVGIAAGAHCSLARRRDGSVVAWGWSGNGECDVPPELRDVTGLAAGGGHTLALRLDESGTDNEPPAIWAVTNMTVIANTGTGIPVTVLARVMDTWDPNPCVTYSLPVGSWLSVGEHTLEIRAFDASGNSNTCRIAINVVPDTEPPVLEGCGDRVVATWRAEGEPLEPWVTLRENADPSPAMILEPPVGTLLPWGEHAIHVLAWDRAGNTNTCSFNVQVVRTPIAVFGRTNEMLHRVPATLTNAIRVAAGGRHLVALNDEERVLAWGDNTFGQCDIPTGLPAVCDIAAGGYFSLALRRDGRVAAWGNNTDGPCDVPKDVTNGIAIAAGFAHGVALLSDETVRAWGWNVSGQCDVPAEATGVVAVAAGLAHTLALRRDGVVLAWGNNEVGQCDTPTDLAGVTAIAAGTMHSLALKDDGTVVAWGDNTWGQCDVPEGLTGVTAIAAGEYHSVALRSDGTVVAWGDNSFMQCNVPVGLSNVTGIAAGGGCSVALMNGHAGGMVRISGWVRHAATGRGVDGVLLAVEGVGNVVTTNGGYYEIQVPRGWSGRILPSFGTAQFVLGTQAFVNVNADMTDGLVTFNWGGVDPSVPLSALEARTDAQGATLRWATEEGLAYDLYTSGDAMTPTMRWQRLVSGVMGRGNEETYLDSSLESNEARRFYTVVLAGEEPGVENVYGVIRSEIRPGFNLTAPALRTDGRFDGNLGQMLAGALEGADDGLGGEGDEVYVLGSNGAWRVLWLDGAGRWREADGEVSGFELEPGQGMYVKRSGGGTVWVSYVGKVGNDGSRQAMLRTGWNLLGLSEGRDVRIADVFGEVAQGGGSEEEADLIVMQDEEGRWRRWMYVDGWGAPYDRQWFDLTTYSVAAGDAAIIPGRAFYYLRRGNQTTLMY